MATNLTELYPSAADGKNISAVAYKAKCAKNFGFKEENSWGVERTRVGGLVSTKVQNYNHLARTIDAIEAGRKESWFSGFSNAATDVAEASIELLEDCRERLVNLEETIKNDKSLNAMEKAEKLKTERAKILNTLKLIRNANNPKFYNAKWLSDFYAEGKKFINSKNVGILTVCIAVPVIAALFIPSPLTPIVFAGLAVFMFARFVSGLWKAASAANQKSMEESGQKVKEMAALMMERDAAKQIPELKKEQVAATQKVDAITVKIVSQEEAYEAARLADEASDQAIDALLSKDTNIPLKQHIKDMQKRIQRFDSELRALELRHAQVEGNSPEAQAERQQIKERHKKCVAEVNLLKKQLPLLKMKRDIKDLEASRDTQQEIATSTQSKIGVLEARQASAQARLKSAGPNQTESIEDLYERTRAGRGKF